MTTSFKLLRPRERKSMILELTKNFERHRSKSKSTYSMQELLGFSGEEFLEYQNSRNILTAVDDKDPVYKNFSRSSSITSVVAERHSKRPSKAKFMERISKSKMGVYNDESKTNNPNEEFIKKFEIEEMEDSEESSSQSGDRNNSSPYQIQADPQNREKPNNDDDANSPLENHFRRNALNQRSKLFRKASDGFKVTVDLMVKRCESNNPLKQYLNNIEPKEIHKRTSSMVDGPLNELPGGPQRNYKVNSIIDSR